MINAQHHSIRYDDDYTIQHGFVHEYNIYIIFTQILQQYLVSVQLFHPYPGA
jgi:hypothetical protein